MSDKSLLKSSLRTAAIACLATWAAVWLLFLSMRLSSIDVRGIPGAGKVVIIALAIALLAPIVAIGLAAAALLRPPRLPLDWLTLGAAIAALLGQVFLFLVSRWL